LNNSLVEARSNRFYQKSTQANYVSGRVIVREELSKIILILIGGGMGAICRYGISLFAVKLFGSGFAWGTLIVNLSGCFLIGISFALADRTILLGPLQRLFFVTGFLGALTTFSTFAVESVQLVRAESSLLALLNILSNNVLGLVLVFLGMRLGRMM
jgi:CrcB protein